MAHTVTRLPRGADGQLGYKVESTHGTAVTVDEFRRHILPLGIKPRIGRYKSEAFVPGLHTRYISGDVMYNDGGEGQVKVELTRLDMLELLRWAVGGTPTSAAQGGTNAYLHTFEPGSMSAAGTSLTIQEGIPSYAGVVEPFTFAGCKCKSFELSGEPDSIVVFTADVDAQSYSHATDLETPTYPATHVPWVWTNAAVVKRAGSALAAVKSWKFSCDNGLKADGRYFDGTGKRFEPREDAYREPTLELDVDLADLSLTFDDMASDTGRAWVVEYVGALADTGYYYTFRLTIPAGYIVSDPPGADSAEEPAGSTLTIEARDNGTDAPYKIEVISTETAV